MSARRVLVVGTTADYIDIIDRRFPQRAMFVTDRRERARAGEPDPDPQAEVLCDLAQPGKVVAAVREHLDQWRMEPSGVACFDCESMALASRIARSLDLSYPTAEAVAACRSKYLSKRLWRQAGLPCPDVELVSGLPETAGFLHRVGGAVVLKPLTGSGSELVFLCRSRRQCAEALATLKSELADHADGRMYAPQSLDGRMVDPRNVFVAEEFVEGEEYSCDFVVDAGRVEVLRIARKVPDRQQSFGTTLAYVLPAELPAGLGEDGFRQQLLGAARALGLERTICMLDFIVRDGQALMIELAPRPGGDCLPPLLLKSLGLDILGCALDLAEGRPLSLPDPSRARVLVGLRLFAAEAGRIGRIDASAVRDDKRVVECHLKREPGHKVVLPPDNYDSRLLGHAIFVPADFADVASECLEIAAKLTVEMTAQPCATTMSS